MARERVDERLVALEYFASKQEAARAILAGEVFFADAAHTKVLKPGQQVSKECSFDVKTLKTYVSRGGEKLKGALRSFGYDMAHKHVVDVGASTGGFTDCALQEGASSVAAIDVGYGQLAWKLRTDERVSVYERTNVRLITPQDVGGPFDVAVADLSFIPLERVLDPIKKLVKSGGDFVILVKPQFEAAKHDIGSKGVVESIDTHVEVLTDVIHEFLDAGLKVHDVAYSPLKGPEGNIEFWIYASRLREEASTSEGTFHESYDCAAEEKRLVEHAYKVVSAAHAALR